MKGEKIRVYFIEIALVIFFLFAIIYNEVITKAILAVVLLVFMVLTVGLIKSDKRELTNNEQIAFLLGGIGIIYVVIVYMLGMITGFYSSTIKLSTWSIINYIIPYLDVREYFQHLIDHLLKAFSYTIVYGFYFLSIVVLLYVILL